MKPTLKQVILWLFFWPFLIPYCLFKRYVFSKFKYGKIYSILAAVFVILVVIGIANSNSSEPKIHYVDKPVGETRLKKAQEKSKLLAKEKSKKEDEYDSLSSKYDSYQESEKSSSEAQSKAEAAASESQSKAAAAAKSKQTQAQQNSAPHNHGNLDTASTGTIIGNSRSKIYHVPGQAGYHMNSVNAVYFSSEQEAINAGYRKAKR